MILFKGYSNIKDFLHRFTLLKIGKLHIRLHRIKDIDRSGFFHNHPFKYVSIVLRGGYTEELLTDPKNIEKKHSAGSVIVRSQKTYHKIIQCQPHTLTLFMAWGNYNWHAINPNTPIHPDGVYLRLLHGKYVWAKRKDDIWFIGHEDYYRAEEELRHSIHQVENDE